MYKIVAVFGEGKDLFHVVNTLTPEAEQPDIVASFPTRDAAELTVCRYVLHAMAQPEFAHEHTPEGKIQCVRVLARDTVKQCAGPDSHVW